MCNAEEDEVNALGMHSQCYNCGGWGHAKRECPTPLKGAGKGGGQYAGRSGFKGGGKDAVSYTHSDAADEEDSVDLGGRRIIKKKKKKKNKNKQK